MTEAADATGAVRRTVPRARSGAPSGRPSAAAEMVRSMNPLVVLAAVVAVVLLAVAILAPWIAPYEPTQQTLLARLRPPVGLARADPRHLLGTDQLGRDILARCIYGLRLSLALAFFGTLVGLAIGVSLGLLAGILGGAVDTVLMAVVDVSLSLPFTLVALFVVAVAGTDVGVLIVVLGIAYWAHSARLVRGQVLGLRDLPYVEAARSAGASGWRLGVTHMLPNIVSPILVMATLNFSNLILLESALSFLGLGVQPPTATLGSMVGQGRDYMISAAWIVAAPAVVIVLVALVVMLLGDFMRDHFDVKLRER